MPIEIETVNTVTSELVEAFARLIPQLSPSQRPPTKAELERIVNSSATTLFIAKDSSCNYAVVGCLTLVLVLIPTDLRSWIEDVVVDISARGQGIGEMLTQAALHYAKQAGAKAVNLTSRPTREAANRLYQRMGFVLRETNVYRYNLLTAEL